MDIPFIFIAQKNEREMVTKAGNKGSNEQSAL